MKTTALAALIALSTLTACHKPVVESEATPETIRQETRFVIPKGEHYATVNSYKAVETTGLKFSVRFDSSAIYQTVDPQNQYDINKLWGFADNGGHHQQYSARMGWRWSDGTLRLFAYTYNKGERDEREIAPVAIGTTLTCSITIVKDSYLFTVNDKQVAMPRLSTTPTAKGYQLYPYFGGDEVAPHEIRIWIEEKN